MKNIITIAIIASIALISCNKQSNPSPAARPAVTNSATAKIKFLEIGSDKCIPCKQMKVVTENIVKKYGDELAFEFIDINIDENATEKYKVQLIPTQIFYNPKGVEIFRHVGYFPEEKIDSLLQANGLKMKQK